MNQNLELCRWAGLRLLTYAALALLSGCYSSTGNEPVAASTTAPAGSTGNTTGNVSGSTGNAAADAVFLAAANPVNVVLTTDATRAVDQVVGVAGGTLSTSDAAGNQYTLDIPANALTGDTAVRMTPVTAISGASFASQFVAGVQFAPDGLSLARLAILTIVPTSPVAADRQTFFASSNGNDLHLAIPGPDPTQLQISVMHFSAAGVIDMSAQERAANIVARAANDQAARLEQEIAQIYQGQRPHELLGDITDMDPADLAKLEADYDSYHQLVVLPRVGIASTSCGNATSALQSVAAEDRGRQIVGTTSLPDVAANMATIDNAYRNMGRPCAYKGVADTSGDYIVNTSVSWLAQKSQGNQEDYKIKSGSLTLTPPLADCTFAPLTTGIDADSGHMVVDYNANPPTYSGFGFQFWNVVQTCGKLSQTVPVLDLFLGTLGAPAQGQVKGSGYAAYIEDTQTEGKNTVHWKFTSCIPTISDPNDPDTCQRSMF